MAAAGHDIKQPLYALGILTDTLLMSDRAESDAPILRRLRSSIDQMSKHFDTLMDIGRFQGDAFELTRIWFDLGEFAARIDLEVAPLCDEKGLAWKLEMEDVPVFTDPELLLRLFRNLLANAMRYTEEGEICCSAKAHADFVEFQVSDTGTGIPTELQEKVFEKFVRLGSNATAMGGSGLGLSIVEKINQALDLDLQMTSVIDVGTVFSFRLARSPPK